MNLYKHILLALDTITNSEDAMDTAYELAASGGTEVSLLYTMPHIGNGLNYQLPSIAEIEERIIEVARGRLAAAASAHDLDDADERVELGNSHDIIIGAALEKEVDLIVVNNDNQQATLISDAPCDILAVRCQ